MSEEETTPIDLVLRIVQRLAKDMKAGFDRVDERFDGVDRRIERLEGRVDGVERRVDEQGDTLKLVVRALASLTTQVDGLEGAVTAIRDELVDHGRRLEALEARP